MQFRLNSAEVNPIPPKSGAGQDIIMLRGGLREHPAQQMPSHARKYERVWLSAVRTVPARSRDMTDAWRMLRWATGQDALRAVTRIARGWMSLQRKDVYWFDTWLDKMSRTFQRQDDPVHVARLEEYLPKTRSALEPLESAIKGPRKFASDVVCQDCLYDALHTSSLWRDLQFKTQPMQGACACRRHPRCCCHVCFGVPVKLQAGYVEMNEPVAVQGRPSRTPVGRTCCHRVATAFRCGAPDQASVCRTNGPVDAFGGETAGTRPS